MQRYFLYLTYNGTPYHGWQIQPNGITVQECVEKALTLLLRRDTPIVGAGRTDTGVHARLMVAHFDTEEALRDPQGLVEKMNRVLPRDIAIYKIVPVRPDAHSRFDALSRTYRYYMIDHKDPFLGTYAWRYHGNLDFDKMNEAASCLFRYTDFTSFSKLHTDVKTNNCLIMKAVWAREGDLWVFEIKADRFLRNMVRAIVGTLYEVGRGKLSVEDFCQVIEDKDRGRAGASVPGNALFLVDIEYPKEIFEES
ncbi:tRNA pseudouridine(38-40) synthase TruA [Coprobacter fastidiosus]